MGRAGQMAQARAKRYSSNSAEQGSQHRFRQHLPDEAVACAAESRANGHLALPHGRTRHENVRDVRTGEQQNERAKNQKQSGKTR